MITSSLFLIKLEQAKADASEGKLAAAWQSSTGLLDLVVAALVGGKRPHIFEATTR